MTFFKERKLQWTPEVKIYSNLMMKRQSFSFWIQRPSFG